MHRWLKCRLKSWGLIRGICMLLFIVQIIIVFVPPIQFQEGLQHKEVLQLQKMVLKEPCRRKLSTLKIRKLENNSAYIVEHFPYIDRRIIRMPNYHNWDDCRHVSKLVSQLKCHSSHLQLLIAVMSHSTRFTRREAIRKSWGNNVLTQNATFLVFFFLANVNDKNVMLKVKKEAAVHGDIVIGDFDEHFNSKSLKVSCIFISF